MVKLVLVPIPSASLYALNKYWIPSNLIPSVSRLEDLTMIKQNKRGAGLMPAAVAEIKRLRAEWAALKHSDLLNTDCINKTRHVLKPINYNNTPTNRKTKPAKTKPAMPVVIVNTTKKVTGTQYKHFFCRMTYFLQSLSKPIHSDVLVGVVALVEVGIEYRAVALRAALRALGASVVRNWSALVTHVIWGEGGSSSIRANARSYAAKLVSPLWVDACTTANEWLPERVFPTATRDSDLPSPRTVLRLLREAQARNLPLHELLAGLTRETLKRESTPEPDPADRHGAKPKQSTKVKKNKKRKSQGTPPLVANAVPPTTPNDATEEISYVNTLPRRALPTSLSPLRSSPPPPPPPSLHSRDCGRRSPPHPLLRSPSPPLHRNRRWPAKNWTRAPRPPLRTPSPPTPTTASPSDDPSSSSSMPPLHGHLRWEAHRLSPTRHLHETSSSPGPSRAPHMPPQPRKHKRSPSPGPSRILPIAPLRHRHTSPAPRPSTGKKEKSPSPGPSRDRYRSPSPGPSWRRSCSRSPGPSWRRNRSPSPGPSWRRNRSPSPGPSWRRNRSPSPGPSWRRNRSPSPGPSWRRNRSPSPGPSWRKDGSPSPGPSWRKDGSPSPGPSWRSRDGSPSPGPSWRPDRPGPSRRRKRSLSPRLSWRRDPSPSPRSSRHLNRSPSLESRDRSPYRGQSPPRPRYRLPLSSRARPPSRSPPPATRCRKPMPTLRVAPLPSGIRPDPLQDPEAGTRRPPFPTPPRPSFVRRPRSSSAPNMHSEKPKPKHTKKNGKLFMYRLFYDCQREEHKSESDPEIESNNQRAWDNYSNDDRRYSYPFVERWVPPWHPNGSPVPPATPPRPPRHNFVERTVMEMVLYNADGDNDELSFEMPDQSVVPVPVTERPLILSPRYERRALDRAERSARRYVDHLRTVSPEPPPPHHPLSPILYPLRPRIVLTGMSIHERIRVTAACNELGGTIQIRVTKTTTHVLIGSFGPFAIDDNAGAPDRELPQPITVRLRTVNALAGAARGCRVLRSQWALDSRRAGAWLPHHAYQILYLKALAEKAAAERHAFGLTRAEYAYDVFNGRRVILNQQCEHREAVIELLALCGAVIYDHEGHIIRNQETLERLNVNRSIHFGRDAIFNNRLVPSPNDRNEDGSWAGSNLANSSDVTLGTQPGRINPRWVFDSITAGRMRSLRRYTIPQNG